MAVNDFDSDSDSDIDPKDERMFDDRLTRVEVRIDGSSRSIVIPLDYNLMTNTKSVVPSLVPFCSSAEN